VLKSKRTEIVEGLEEEKGLEGTGGGQCGVGLSSRLTAEEGISLVGTKFTWEVERGSRRKGGSVGKK